jgi:predicted MFS family arabinose efflux permease
MVAFFDAVFWTAFSAHFFDVMSRGEEGVGMAGRNITLYTASGIAPIIAGVLATKFGFGNLFMLGAAISVSGILVALTLKDHNHAKKLCYLAMHEEYANILKIKGLSLIAGIIFLVDFVFVFWSIFMPIWLLQIGISLDMIGVLLSANLLIGALLQIPIGKAIDKWPIRTILIPGFLMFWLGGVLFFAFKNYISYFFNRVIMLGTGSDMAYWPAVSMLAKLTPNVDNGGAVALIFGLSAAIKGFGALAGGYLAQMFGIETVLVAVSYLALAAAVILIPFKILKKKGTQFHKAHHHRAHVPNR